MALDAHANFAYSLVATAPSPATSGTSLVVTAGQGALFPAVPFNATIWPASSQPSSTNAEIVRVTARSTDTLTITRAQEGTSARTVVVGDQIAATITKKTLTDIEANPTQGYYAGTNSIIRETIDRNLVRDNNLTLTTQVMFSQSIMLYKDDIITKIAIRSSGATTTPTNYWFALYDNQATPALIAQTADQTTTAWAATTLKDLSLTGGPFTISTTGIYWIAIMVKATTPPTLFGQTAAASAIAGGMITGMVPLSQTSGSALTTTAPGTITGGTASASSMYAIAH